MSKTSTLHPKSTSPRKMPASAVSRTNREVTFAVPATNVKVKEVFARAPENYSSQTGIEDWEELVDPPSGRVFFYSEKHGVSRWGLPLESLATKDEELKQIKGWCLHVDPSTQNKFFACEEKSKAQWRLPDDFDDIVASTPYLNTRRSWAVQQQKMHSRPRPKSVEGRPGSDSGFPEAPTMRRLTLRMLVQNLTLDKVICDREAFQAFQVFAATYHAEENVLFYCVVEAFSKRGSKAVGVLGLDDLAKTAHKGLPRTQSHLNQIALDQKRAERSGTNIEKIQMIREASAIYSRFLAPGAADWVCVDQKIVEEVGQQLFEAREDPKIPLDRTTIFEKAQHYVFKNLEHDLLPRFVKASLSRDESAVAEEPVRERKHGVFEPDEVLRHHLIQLQKRPEGVVSSLMSTANAYRSLFPSPRYAIEGREGSGLSPFSLTSVDGKTEKEDVLAKPAPGSQFDRKSIVMGRIRPFSSRMFSTGSVGNDSKKSSDQSQMSSLKSQSIDNRPSMDVAAGATFRESSIRRQSTGTNRASGNGTIMRSRSKSDGDNSEDGLPVQPIDLDAVEFDIPL